MGAPLREILAQFQIIVNDKPLNDANDNIDKAKGKAEGLGGALKKIGTTLLATFAVGAVKGFIQDQIELGSSIKDTSDRLGVGTDELQQFQYAAKLSGVSGEEAAASLGHLNRSIGEALNGSAEAAKNFSAMGVSLKDANGQTRPTLDVLTDLADHFQATDDPAKKTALAMSVLGRSGTALIPVLNQGGDAVRGLFKEANDLGGVLGKDFIENADAAGDQIDRFGFAMQGVKANLALSILPTITDFATTLTHVAGSVNALSKNTTLLKTGFIALIVALTAAAIVGGILDLEFIIMALSIVAVIVVVALLYLAFDDLYNLWNGNKSVSGEILDFFIGMGQKQALIDGLKQSVNQLVDSLGILGGKTPDVGEAFTTLAEIGIKGLIFNLKVVSEFIDGILTSFTYLLTFVNAAKASIDAGSSLGTALDAGKLAGRSVATDFKDRSAARWSTVPLAYQANAQAAKVDVTNQYNVQVDGAGKDGKQIGQDIVTGATTQQQNKGRNSAAAYGAGL